MTTAMVALGLNSMRTGATPRVLAAAVPTATSTPGSNAVLAFIESVRHVTARKARVRRISIVAARVRGVSHGDRTGLCGQACLQPRQLRWQHARRPTRRLRAGVST